MISRPSFEIALPRDVGAPGIARGQLARWFGAALAGRMLDTARLLTSELVTNAVLHGRGRIRLRAELSEDRLLVEVFDDGDGFNWKPRGPDGEPGPGGWGLFLVEADSSRWGVGQEPTHVWFELDR